MCHWSPLPYPPVSYRPLTIRNKSYLSVLYSLKAPFFLLFQPSLYELKFYTYYSDGTYCVFEIKEIEIVQNSSIFAIVGISMREEYLNEDTVLAPVEVFSIDGGG